MSVKIRKFSEEEKRVRKIIAEALGGYPMIAEAKRERVEYGRSANYHYNDGVGYDNNIFGTHIPEQVTDHPFIRSEFEVYRKCKLPVFEAEKEYPQTLTGELVKKTIIDFMEFDEDDISTIYAPESDKIPIVIVCDFPDVEMCVRELEKLDDVMYKCGYFRCIPDKFISGMRKIQYEPYYYKDRMLIKKDIYHITLLKNKESILEKGFVPSCLSTRFTYPDRNFFFLKLKEEMIKYMRNEKKSLDETEIDCTIFTVNTEKIPDVRFYCDPKYLDRKKRTGKPAKMYANSAVYTYSSVGPETIVKTHDLTV